MFKRPSFWLGLLLGGLASLGALRLGRSPQSRSLDPLFGLVGEAVVICDASGGITDVNAAARALFGTGGVTLNGLRYSSGQPVPPGQSPINRVLRTGRAMEGTGYLSLSAGGKTRVLDIKAGPLPGGGAVLIACDRTEAGEVRAREAKAQGRETALRALCRRLSAAPDAEEMAQALVESALALVDGLPGVRVRLHAYDSAAKRLTRLASAPEERPKRPRSHRQAQRPTFPFDASSPLLWSVYVAREPFAGAGVGDDAACPSYAFPLLIGGAAAGHLSVSCPDGDVLADADLRETLGLFASVAVLALAGPSQAAQTAPLTAQAGILYAIIGAVAGRMERAALADLINSEVCRVTGAEVCTLALEQGNHLRVAGTSYQDALVSPDRHAPDDATLIGDAAREAMSKGKTVQRVGLANPSFEAGVWRAFAGQSGRHSVLSAPLAAGQGALTVYTAGDAPFQDAQVRFLEALAALVSLSPPEASRSTGYTGS